MMEQGARMVSPHTAAELLPLRERLMVQRKRLMDQVAKIDQLQELVEQHPEFEKFHNLLVNTSGY
jgi:hypothetical protein